MACGQQEKERIAVCWSGKLKNVLHNIEKNIEFSLNILHGNADIEYSRSDFENWLPIEFIINIDGEIYNIGEACDAMMTVFETSDLIQGLMSIINNDIDVYNYNSSEALFSINLALLKEDECVEFEIWINLAAITKGNNVGYDKGVRFIATIEETEQFYINFRKQYEQLIPIYRRGD